jgi:sporulation protein YlmC with PRC-barrel domain
LKSGQELGRVHEIRINNGKVTHLICGPMGLLQRLTRTRAGHRIAWTRVIKITADAIEVDDGAGD